ncbi:SMP-30/gluconolactonase/LRE family protein [Agaribacter flavus]|uniref:SMP-30/gluconolactonase/LRE family protein n=1 Tax=Agaribacter flavus TaxID=1902781 RepID=A0ABV7FR17_9ALTE
MKNLYIFLCVAVNTFVLFGCANYIVDTTEGVKNIPSKHANDANLVNKFDGREMLAVGEHIGFIEILSPKAKDYLRADTPIVIEANNFNWIEGPVWVEAENFLLFSDVPENKIYKFSPENGVSLYIQPSGYNKLYPNDEKKGSNGLAIDNSGRLVLMQVGDRRVSRMTATLSDPRADYETIQSHYNDKRFNGPNDIVFHSSGMFFMTDPPYGLSGKLSDPKKELPFQGVFRVEQNGEAILLDDTLSFPNGIGLSPDERILYVAVSDGRKQFKNAAIHAYDLNSIGDVSNKRELVNGSHLIDLPGEQGNFDGMDVHSSGVIFATAPGGVWLIMPTGEVIAKIRTKQKNGNCTLSADEKMLYIAADGYLLNVALK